MHHNVLFLVGSLLAVVGPTVAQYQLVDNYQGAAFFDGFTFFDQKDPTNGVVNYVNAEQANKTALGGYVGDKIYLGVDRQSGPSPHRDSTRVSSNKKYNKGLFIADFEHMPAGCSIWPAYWTFGENWPYRGEIDILEGVNSDTVNHVTLHTSEGCTLTNSGLGGIESTVVKETDCGKDNGHTGCGQTLADPQAYGPGFNANKGGVYAMEWTSATIKTWFFPRGSEQVKALSDASATPDISTFGPPRAIHGGGGCDIDKHFADHNIIFDTTLCGDWAGHPNVWAADQTCSKKAPSCTEYVAGAGKEEFEQAFWLINYVRVYQQNGVVGEKPAYGNGTKVAFTA